MFPGIPSCGMSRTRQGEVLVTPDEMSNQSFAPLSMCKMAETDQKRTVRVDCLESGLWPQRLTFTLATTAAGFACADGYGAGNVVREPFCSVLPEQMNDPV